MDGGRWPFTGRKEELRSIADTFADTAIRGVVIAGTAGVGKSRLAAEAARRHGRLVHHVAGTVSGRQIALGAFARWLGAAWSSPLQAAHQVIGALTAESGPDRLVLVVDDAHLLDDVSAFVVHELLLSGAARMLLTIRSGQPAPDAVTKPWKDGLLHRMELQALSRNESDDLLTAHLGGPVTADLASQMWELTRGNPLLLTHLVRQEESEGGLHVAGELWRGRPDPPVSQGLRDLVDMEFGAATDQVGDVVDLVAAAGTVERRTLNRLTDPDAVAEAELRGLITTEESGESVRITHPLYARIRSASCGPLRLRRLRGRLAVGMAETTADPVHLGLLWLDSDLAPDTAVLTRATEMANARLDLDSALRCGCAAVAAGAGTVAVAELAHTLSLLGRNQEARKLAAELPASENQTFNRVCTLLATGAATLDSAPNVGAHLRNTLRGLQHAYAAEPAAAISVTDAADPTALDEAAKLAWLTARTHAFGELGQTGRADATAAEQRILVGPAPSRLGIAALVDAHTEALLLAGLLDEADKVVQCAATDTDTANTLVRRLDAAAGGAVALGRGDLRAAARLLSPDEFDLGAFGTITAHSYRAHLRRTVVHARLGDVAGATLALSAARACARPQRRYLEPASTLAEAWVLAAAGKTGEARELAARAAAQCRRSSQFAREVECLQTAVQFGDVTVAERLDELARVVDGPRAPIAARYARAFADRDASELAAASQEFESIGDLLTAADAAGHAAATFRSARLQGSALTAAGRAESLAHRCGGARSPALAAGRVALPFTQREREIALLLGQGMTNRQIAAALSLSVRTVEGHVYRASFKAGVGTRADLAALMAQFDHGRAGG